MTADFRRDGAAGAVLFAFAAGRGGLKAGALRFTGTFVCSEGIVCVASLVDHDAEGWKPLIWVWKLRTRNLLGTRQCTRMTSQASASSNLYIGMHVTLCERLFDVLASRIFIHLIEPTIHIVLYILLSTFWLLMISKIYIY